MGGIIISYIEQSKRESKNSNGPSVELITITTSANDSIKICGEGIAEYRDMLIIAPGGFAWNPSEGSSGQLIKNWNTGNSTSLVGLIVDKKVEPGEVLLYSDKATILLKNDGSVIVNDVLKIDTDGNIETDGTITAKEFISK